MFYKYRTFRTKMSTKNPPNFECKICNYKTVSKRDYNKHLSTRKHQNRTLLNKKVPKSPQFICGLCNKSFNARNSLWYHKKKCTGVYESDEDSYLDEHAQDDAVESDTIVALIKQNQEFKELLFEQSKQLQDTQNQLVKTNEQNMNMQIKLLDAFKDGKTINNTTNNNQKFNLNFFLNTTCKDAMNMSEFIENMNINVKDIENIGKNGYVSGMTDMILSRIKELDVTKRPVHCTDLKRETMYIKDNNEWSKDTPENSKLHKMIGCVAKRNYAFVPVWRKQHPESDNWEHPEYDFCVNMMRNILGDIGNEQIKLDNKVIKKLSRHILIDK